MYYNGTYTIRDVHKEQYCENGSWRCDLEVTGYYVTGYGYTPRGAMRQANKAMNKIMKYKRICEAVKSACEPPEGKINGNVQEHIGSVDSPGHPLD